MTHAASGSRVRSMLVAVVWGVLFVAPAALGWLFQPLTPAGPRSMVRVFSGRDVVLAVETRRASLLHERLCAASVPEAAARLLRTSVAPIHLDMADLLEATFRSDETRMIVDAVDTQAVFVLLADAGWAPAAATRLSNLHRTLLRLYLRGAGTPENGAVRIRQDGAPDLFATVSRRWCLVAMTPKGIDVLRAAVFAHERGDDADDADPLFDAPEAGLIARWFIRGDDDAVDGGGTATVHLDETVRGFSEAPPAAADDPPVLSVAATLPVSTTWTTLSTRLWPEHGRPVASTDDAVVVLLHRMLEESVSPRVGNRLVAQIRPAPPMDDAVPAPRLSVAVALDEADGVAAGLRSGTERIIDYFRQPFGPRSWQAIRRSTRTVPLPPTESDAEGMLVIPHRLFFRGMTPWWAVFPADTEGAASTGGTVVFGTHGGESRIVSAVWPDALRALQTPAIGRGAAASTISAHRGSEPGRRSPLPDVRSAPPGDAPSRRCRFRMDWNMPSGEAEGWERFVVDLADVHMWAPEEIRPAVVAGAGLLRACFEAVPEGRITGRVALPPATPSTRTASEETPSEADAAPSAP